MPGGKRPELRRRLMLASERSSVDVCCGSGLEGGDYMSYSLNSLKGGYVGDESWGEVIICTII